MIYLIYNEGYSAGGPGREASAFADEAIRLGRLLLRIFPAEPEIMGLLALMLLQQSRNAGALRCRRPDHPARRNRTGRLWNRKLIDEALALLDKAIRHRRPGPYQLQAAIAALHSRAKRAEDTDWAEIDPALSNAGAAAARRRSSP